MPLSDATADTDPSSLACAVTILGIQGTIYAESEARSRMYSEEMTN